jgi:hypothetical protein
MSTIRDTVTVTAVTPVDGSPQRKAPRPYSRSGPLAVIAVHPDVMAAARRAMRPGQHLVIISETEVVLRNDTGAVSTGGMIGISLGVTALLCWPLLQRFADVLPTLLQAVLP